jgi:hypothetical protein
MTSHVNIFRLFVAAAMVSCALAVGPEAAGAESNLPPFGFESTGAMLSTSAAGLHPDFVTSFVLDHQEKENEFTGEQMLVTYARVQEIGLELPPGLVGSPTQYPRCAIQSFNAFGNCPTASQIGIVTYQLNGNSVSEKLAEPLFNLEPTKREVARFGFFATVAPAIIDVSVRTAGDYGLTATVHDAPGTAPLLSVETTIWGDPADPVHDEQRLNTFEALGCVTACNAPGGKRESGLTPRPFLSNASACQQQTVQMSAVSYARPAESFIGPVAVLPASTGCSEVPFEPSFRVETSSRRADSPTGLGAILRIPQTNSSSIPSTSTMRSAKVVLPLGMTISPGTAQGLEACSDADVGLGREVESTCPAGSRLGSVEFVSPALPEPMHGSIYQRTPGNGDLFRIWLVADEFGLHLKLPGEIHPDATSGQLTAEFTNTPPLPVEKIDLEFRAGPTAPLRNPGCGSYSAHYEIAPWSGAAPSVGASQPFVVDQDCGRAGFSPQFEAGVTDAVAGSYSPFVAAISRNDREDNVVGFELKLPKGELAKLAGVPLCPDGAAPSGSCPAGSRVGDVKVAAGSGSQPLWIPQPGKAPTAVYLAGAYKGAPYSLVTTVPAQAGPFDLGTVVVRSGIYVDPDSTQVTVKSDPLPQILEGVPVLYRAIDVSVDRDRFTISPTNCEQMSVDALIAAAGGAVANPSDRFQVGECAALEFAPDIALKLKGGTKRGKYPALTATLTTHKEEANFSKVQVALPHSEFLAQEHIKTICTRVQFSQNACPANSIYGVARAVTPLLDQPLEGPVYLRSSSHKLPDLVAALRGPLDINLDGRIDSFKGGIRTTFTGIPDALVSKFVLKMRGGSKSLLVNSTDICRGQHRATVSMSGQNGRTSDLHPRLGAPCRH